MLWVRRGVHINLSFGFSNASDTSNDKVLTYREALSPSNLI